VDPDDADSVSALVIAQAKQSHRAGPQRPISICNRFLAALNSRRYDWTCSAAAT
jgi:hypothetical protein